MNLPDSLTLVTISYNSAHIIGSHINGLQNCPPNERPRHIIVDNNSHDNTHEIVTQHPHVELISNPDNRGFGTACNQGIHAATTPFVIILNPDTQISAEALKTLLEALISNPKAAIAGPNVEENSSKTGTDVVDWVIGAAVLIDKEKIEPIGYFDEEIFLYYEENELYIRTQKAGFDIIQCHDSKMPHIGGASTQETPELNTFLSWHRGRSHRIVAAKHPDHFISLDDYIKKQRKSLFRAKLTFNKRRKLDAEAKIAGATASTKQPQ